MWKTLSDPDHNTDEDPAGRVVDVKPATWRSKWYDVRSEHPCVLSKSRVVYHGNKGYWKYECKNFTSLGCYAREMNKCKPCFTYITDLRKSVISGCKCASGKCPRILKLKREDAF